MTTHGTGESQGVETIRQWVARHEACWEMAPLVEVIKGAGRKQTGVELRIYAQVEHEDEAEIEAAYAQVRSLAEQLAPVGDSTLEFDVEDYDEGETLRGETGFAEEVMVPIVMSFRDPDHQPDHAALARIMDPIEAKLRELGLKPKAWDSKR